jgi:hypothetical protein
MQYCRCSIAGSLEHLIVPQQNVMDRNELDMREVRLMDTDEKDDAFVAGLVSCTHPVGKIESYEVVLGSVEGERVYFLQFHGINHSL